MRGVRVQNALYLPPTQGYLNTGAVVRFSLSFVNTALCSSVHWNAAPFLRSLWRGLANSAKFGTNLRYQLHSLKKACSSCKLVGGFQSCTSLTRAVFGWTPSPLTKCPRNNTSSWSKWHFNGFNFNPQL